MVLGGSRPPCARVMALPLVIREPPPVQNAKRKANCMKRGVVSVELYFPNWSGAKPSEGCALRTL